MFRLLPNAKLIALLRDPVDRAISHYFDVVHWEKEFLSIEEAFLNEERNLINEKNQLLDMEKNLKERIIDEIEEKKSNINNLQIEIPKIKKRVEFLAKMLKIPVIK